MWESIPEIQGVAHSCRSWSLPLADSEPSCETETVHLLVAPSAGGWIDHILAGRIAPEGGIHLPDDWAADKSFLASASASVAVAAGNPAHAVVGLRNTGCLVCPSVVVIPSAVVAYYLVCSFAAGVVGYTGSDAVVAAVAAVACWGVDSLDLALGLEQDNPASAAVVAYYFVCSFAAVAVAAAVAAAVGVVE